MQRVQGHDMVSLLLDLDWNAKSSLEFTKENHKNRFSPPGLPSVFEKNQLQIELPGIYILAATMIQAVCFVSHLWLLCFQQEKRVVSVGNFRIEIQWLHPFSSPSNFSKSCLQMLQKGPKLLFVAIQVAQNLLKKTKTFCNPLPLFNMKQK